MEATSIFAVSGYQYVIMAVVVTKAYPYKKPLYHNCEAWFILLRKVLYVGYGEPAP